MALRLIEVITPVEKKEMIEALRKETSVIDAWQEERTRSRYSFKILLQAEDSEKMIDKISRLFKKGETFRLIVQDVEATLPLVETPPAQIMPVKKHIGRLSVSREELYNQVVSMAQFNYVYVLMVALAAVIASFGFIEDKWVVIIGSMVVAPLIAPNIALSLGVVLGDMELGKMGLWAMGGGVLIALFLALAIGLVYPFELTSQSLQGSLVFNYPDLIVALASGVAGVLAFTTGTAFALIGVMVSISLLPPLVTAGLVLGKGEFLLFGDAMMLFFANFVALNLSGVVTFWFQGVRPKNWWEAKKAKKYRTQAIIAWIFMLIVLIVSIYVKHRYA
jgi:uncharacterized hydrophobic protein (TIGR00341 family)